MKKTLYILTAVALFGVPVALTSCDDDKSDPDIPVTDLTLSGWSFSPDMHEDVCIGEIKTKDLDPIITPVSTNPDIQVTVAKVAPDDGLQVYKILANMPQRVVSGMISSTVEVEVQGKTDERVYKKVEINQYGTIPAVTLQSLAGTYTLVEHRELDADDGDVEINRYGVAAKLSFAANGKVAVSNVAGIDDFRNGTFNAIVSNNTVTIDGRNYKVLELSSRNGTVTLVLEYLDMKGMIIDEYEQYIFTATRS